MSLVVTVGVALVKIVGHDGKKHIINSDLKPTFSCYPPSLANSSSKSSLHINKACTEIQPAHEFFTMSWNLWDCKGKQSMQ